MSKQRCTYDTVSKFFTSYIETWRVPAKVFNPPNFYFSYDVKDVVNSLGEIQVLFPILEAAASFTQSAASTPPTTAAEDAAFLPSSQVCTTIHQCCGS